jgi:hypothetical protein
VAEGIPTFRYFFIGTFCQYILQEKRKFFGIEWLGSK